MTEQPTSQKLRAVFLPNRASLSAATQDLLPKWLHSPIVRLLGTKGDTHGYQVAYVHVGLVFGALIAAVGLILYAVGVPSFLAAVVAIAISVVVGGEIALGRHSHLRTASLIVVVLSGIWRAIGLAASMHTGTTFLAMMLTTAVAFLSLLYLMPQPQKTPQKTTQNTQLEPTLLYASLVFVLLLTLLLWILTPVTTLQTIIFIVVLFFVLPGAKLLLPYLRFQNQKQAAANGSLVVYAAMWLGWMVA